MHLWRSAIDVAQALQFRLTRVTFLGFNTLTASRDMLSSAAWIESRKPQSQQSNPSGMCLQQVPMRWVMRQLCTCIFAAFFLATHKSSCLVISCLLHFYQSKRAMPWSSPPFDTTKALQCMSCCNLCLSNHFTPPLGKFNNQRVSTSPKKHFSNYNSPSLL